MFIDVHRWLSVQVYIHHVCAMPLPRNWSYRWSYSLTWVARTEIGPLEEQRELLATEPSLLTA